MLPNFTTADAVFQFVLVFLAETAGACDEEQDAAEAQAHAIVAAARKLPADQRAAYVTAHRNAHLLADQRAARIGCGGGYAENAAIHASYVEAHRAAEASRMAAGLDLNEAARVRDAA